jgi:hypothetical protein
MLIGMMWEPFMIFENPKKKKTKLISIGYRTLIEKEREGRKGKTLGKKKLYKKAILSLIFFLIFCLTMLFLKL